MRILIPIFWILLGIFYWFCKENCCGDQAISDSASVVSEIKKVAPIESRTMQKLTPISFKCSDDVPSTDAKWAQFRDSLLTNLKTDSKLEIRGLYAGDETSNGSENLGLARAKNVLKLFDNLGSDKVKIVGDRKGDKCLKEELNNLITFRYLKNTIKIKEVGDRTLIYFPFNSTNRLVDTEVENYLNEVAKRVVASGERVRLTGHTDSIDSEAFNMNLGELRATFVSDYLIRKGVNPNKIMIRSKGERDPIGDNATEDGRAKNRRTELQILKN